jgi:hypothetical protein
MPATYAEIVTRCPHQCVSLYLKLSGFELLVSPERGGVCWVDVLGISHILWLRESRFVLLGCSLIPGPSPSLFQKKKRGGVSITQVESLQ